MRRAFYYLVAIGALFLAWSLASWLLQVTRGQAVLPYPWETLIKGYEYRDQLSSAFGASARRFSLSLLFAFFFGLPLGLAIGSNSLLHRWLSPLIYILYPVPPVALLIFLYLVFGIGEAVKIVVVSGTLFFQVLVAALGAARNISSSHILAVRSLGANSLQLHRYVILPAVLPDVFTAARVSVGLGMTMLYISETKLGFLGGPSTGLGVFIEAYTMRSDLSLAGVVGLAFLGLAFYVLLEILERRICRWKYVGKGGG